MQPTLCTRCHKNVAVIFISKIENGETKNEGLCLKCAKELGIKPIAELVSFAVAGCEPDYMGLGPIYAAPKALEKAGLTVADLDVVELNEAFAAQAIPCMKELGLDPAKTNPNGGAMALGHPQGATGAFLTCKALNELKRTGGKYAMVTMCIGGGMGAAGIYKML